MTVQDIIDLLMNGEMGGIEDQEMVAQLILQLCQLQDATLKREIDHLLEIRELREKLKASKRLRNFDKRKQYKR